MRNELLHEIEELVKNRVPAAYPLLGHWGGTPLQWRCTEAQPPDIGAVPVEGVRIDNGRMAASNDQPKATDLTLEFQLNIHLQRLLTLPRLIRRISLSGLSGWRRSSSIRHWHRQQVSEPRPRLGTRFSSGLCGVEFSSFRHRFSSPRLLRRLVLSGIAMGRNPRLFRLTNLSRMSHTARSPLVLSRDDFMIRRLGFLPRHSTKKLTTFRQRTFLK